MSRYLSKYINEFAEKKLVLIAGPRQVGKTTLGQKWLPQTGGKYLSWDDPESRANILKRNFLESSQVNSILLDEIHKYPRWKNYLKGLYDKHRQRLHIVVTGSARLNIYQRSGDSLFGRYELLRLHPFSIGELTNGTTPPPPDNWLKIQALPTNREHWLNLTKFGGFPEPFLRADPLQHQRWSLQRRQLLIRQDIREISEIKMIDLVEHLYLLLPERVGSTLSVNSLREELQVAFNTVTNWLINLEHLYICYRLLPYHRKIARSLKKETKLYLWDWSQIQDVGARFENIIASHLLKSVHAWNDLGYGDFDLMYWRNKEKQEVDFVLCNHKKPIVLFESKVSDLSLSKSLSRLSSELGGIPAIQLIDKEGIDATMGNCRVVSADAYLANLV